MGLLYRNKITTYIIKFIAVWSCLFISWLFTIFDFVLELVRLIHVENQLHKAVDVRLVK